MAAAPGDVVLNGQADTSQSFNPHGQTQTSQSFSPSGQTQTSQSLGPNGQTDISQSLSPDGKTEFSQRPSAATMDETSQPLSPSADAGPPPAKNIVVLGAGFAGLSASHYFMKHIYPKLKSDDKDKAYRLILVDQSTHFWWHISAPRAIASTKLIQHNKAFFPLDEGFKQYGEDQDIMEFKQAQPVSVDTKERLVTIKYVNDESNADDNTPARVESIPYYALIIATGGMTPTPITSFHGGHTKSQKALDDINQRLARATSVIIAGGGPVAVETAGEVGEALNGTSSSVKSRKVKITVIAGGSKLLPVLGEKYTKKSTKFLDKVGVDVVYNKRVSSVGFEAAEAGKTTITLDDGKTMTADVYIPATGTKPNTSFLPPELRNDRGYVETNPGTLRVDKAGERVYALGDVGSYTRGGVIDLYAATPVFGNNFAVDLGVRSGDKQHKSDTSETQIVPVGSKGGVGAFKGFGMPSIAIRKIKGGDYMLSMTKQITWGEKYKKP